VSSSSRNAWHRRCLAATPHLTSTAWRLVGALDLCVLGFSKTEEHLGEQLLRETADLHGRSFQRARDELIARGLLRYESGGGGRGHRSRYVLLVDDPETPALERGITPRGNPAQTPAGTPAQTPALERARIRNSESGRTSLEKGTQQGSKTGLPFVPHLSSYTGCRAVRGEMSIGHKYDPLGKDPTPAGWTHPRPSHEEVARALGLLDSEPR
jgi:hypothetical protein